FAIPENPQFTYHEETGELTVYTADGQEAGTVQMPKNEGKTVFPVVVKDKDGNLYKVEDESGETAGDGATANGEEKQLKATYIGKQTDPLPRLDNVNVAADVATVTFSKGAGKFTFDTWQDYYGSVSVIESKKVYEHLACGDRRYDVPWKLLPEGESDVVEAKIEIRDKSLDPEKVIFSTPQGTVYKHVYDPKKQTYALTLVAGADGDVQEIYALNKLSGASYQTLGKLNVITCRRQTPRVALVSVNDYTADVRTVKNELDRIYNPVGITWEVATDTFSYLADRDYFEKGSGLLKAYNEKMTALQNAYRAARGGIEKNTCYVFVLNYSGGDNDRNTAGFMPHGKQFGYIFLSGISKNEAGHVIAHELGHGLWKLKHTFDDSYGKTAAATEGTTDNLMDYNKGAHLAKWQWDVMREPAIFDGVFDSDEEGMMAARACAAPQPVNKGTLEAEHQTTEGLEYIGFGASIKCSKTWYYHLGSEEKKSGWYEYENYLQIPDVKNFIIDYALASGNISVNTISEWRVEPAVKRIETEVLSGRLSDDFFNTIIYLNRKYSETCSKYTLEYSGSGLATPIYPEFDIIFIFTGLDVTKIATIGVAKTFGALRSIGIQTLAKFSKLGYQLKLVGPEYVLFSELNVEIARFGSNGLVLTKYITNSPPSICIFVDNVYTAFEVTGKGAIGRLVLWKTPEGDIVWQIVDATGNIGIRESWPNFINIFKANTDEIVEAATKIKNYRIANNLKGGNYGYLEGTVNGKVVDSKMWRSVSQASAKEEIHIFRAIEAEGAGGAWLRITDSEYRMLNDLAYKLGGKAGVRYPNVHGEIKIISELPYCNSCQGIIQQFNEMFPNIKLILIDGVK
ncbi:MAG: hypothetical protein LBL58_18625, partial [Tannerellaceae bacterium]|nr:hypothetical protein [Tannerellaceae bacterium]